MGNNTQVIEQYDLYITKIEMLISEVEQNTVLDRQQKYKLIERLYLVINHCKDKVNVLNGSFVPSQNSNFNKRGY